MSVNIAVPDLGESVLEATVLRWLKQEGEHVAAGESVVELETEKVNLEVGTPRAGVLSHIEHQAGEDVKIGEVLGVIEESILAETTAPGQPSDMDMLRSSREDEPKRSVAPAGDMTPVAKRLAEGHGVDISQVPATGSDGRITKQDVLNYLEGQKVESPVAPSSSKAEATPPTVSAPQREVEEAGTPPQVVSKSATAAAPTDREERVRLSRRRQTIARRLVEAQHTAAMLTTFNEIDMTGVVELRKQRKEAFRQRYGVSLGITSFFVKAVIGALKAFPRLNAEIQDNEMVLKHYYDIGIAVGAAEGLVVPVLREADRLSFPEIENSIGEFAQKSETGAFSIEDLRGGTFTITNGGVFGSLLSTPILNPPQVGILGLHKIEERPIAREGQVVIRPMMYVALSYDHRIVDGREAVQFLVKVKELVEDPAALLLEG